MDYNNIIFEKKDKFVLITLNRPDKLNALNKLMLEELDNALISLEEDPSINALIITGSGIKSFASGADIKEFQNCDVDSARELSEYGSNVFYKLSNLTIPTIAAINGYALGGGLELALSCNIRFASENSKFGFPELNLGLIPGYGGTQRLPALIGKSKAMELILSSKIIDSIEAERIGLVNAIFPLEQLLNKTEKFLHSVISKSQYAISSAIDCIDKSDYFNGMDGFLYESKSFGQLFNYNNTKESINAFIEKRTSS